jgi:hypothetical protein
MGFELGTPAIRTCVLPLDELQYRHIRRFPRNLSCSWVFSYFMKQLFFWDETWAVRLSFYLFGHRLLFRDGTQAVHLSFYNTFRHRQLSWAGTQAIRLSFYLFGHRLLFWDGAQAVHLSFYNTFQQRQLSWDGTQAVRLSFYLFGHRLLLLDGVQAVHLFPIIHFGKGNCLEIRGVLGNKCAGPFDLKTVQIRETMWK